uniref:Transmembrane and ubiquitin-like domain-containing protein 1 n=1 Tax=Salarias fasciatus TaxID=181472 RepID=A0A672FCL2_SALFA
MALIEGVGDEVTLLFGSLLLLLVLLLAWISTRTPEPQEHLFTASVSVSQQHRTGPRPPGLAPRLHQRPVLALFFFLLAAVVVRLQLRERRLRDRGPARHRDPPGGGGGRRDGRDCGRRWHQEQGSRRRKCVSEDMVVRLKFLNDTERTAQVKPQDTIGYIKRTYFAGQEQQVRLIYQGQLLQDDAQTLASLNLVHNCVLHCHISQHAGRGAAGGPRPADQVQVALNVGSLMVPLLVFMLSVLWYCQIQYRQFFTAPATASLVGVTIFLSLVAFGVYRR